MPNHFLVVLLLCGVASPAFAGKRYVEVWNPPEAQRKSVVRHHHIHRRVHMDPRAPAAVQTPPVTNAVTPVPAELPEAPTQKASDALPRIPPKIGPDGRVLRVKPGCLPPGNEKRLPRGEGAYRRPA